MKSDHRHELKTNELAEWIEHFPEWVSENRTSLIAVGAVVVVALGVYFVKFYRRGTVSVRQHVRLTNLVTQLPRQEENIARALSQGVDQSITLLPTVQDLQDFAQSAKSDEMAAVALIKRAEALRAELHYRLADVSREDLVQQIGQAQTSYRQALERAPSVPALAATAQFGLGLCEEELGNFDQARGIYEQVASDAAYSGTAAQAAAAHRLTTMDDYRTTVVFKAAPPKPAAASAPSIQVGPSAVNQPIVIQAAPDESTEAGPNTPTQDSNETTSGTAPASVPEANEPAGS
jgi:tetratricopeptide (TPR) repeat protein